MKFRLYIAIFAFVYTTVVAYPTVRKALRSKTGSDYASYHYAAHAVWGHESPYNARTLSKYARKEGTRKNVHPFFYPPPAIIAFLWSPFFSLSTSFAIFAALSNLLWLFCLWLMRKMLGVSWVILALVAIFFCPVGNSIRMGQVNLLVLFFMLLAIRKKSGGWISLAAMIKMSPAFVVFQWGSSGRLRSFLIAALGAVFLTIISLAVVDLPEQIRFYTEILPTFSAGPYHQLSVPITLPANHSFADIWNQIWPGASNFELSQRARLANSLTILGLLGALCVVGFRTRKNTTDIPLTGAMVALMTVTPLYAYEHHLVFSAFPMVIVLHALHKRILSSHWLWLVVPSVVFLSMTLGDLRYVQGLFPKSIGWIFQEAKFFAVLVFGVICSLLTFVRAKVWPMQTETELHLQNSSDPK